MRKRRRRLRREEGRGCHCSQFQGRWRNLKEAWREKDAKVRLLNREKKKKYKIRALIVIKSFQTKFMFC